jgi:hypothetical protein
METQSIFLTGFDRTCYGMTMKNIIITYSNGDKEKTFIDGPNEQSMMKETIYNSFQMAWTRKDDDGQYRRILNMAHVRSIEVEDDKEPGVD